MINPEITFDGEYYHVPFEPIEYPEIKEGYLPGNVNLHFDFGKHDTRADFEWSAEMLKQADIYIPEYPFYTSQDVKLIKTITKSSPHNFKKLEGKLSADAFGYAQFQALRGTYKTVVMADISKEDGLSLPTLNYPISLDLDATLEKILPKVLNFVEVNEKRNSIIISNLGPKISESIECHPRLRDQEQVNALMRIGSLHKVIYAELAQSPHTNLQVSARTQFVGHTDLYTRTDLYEPIATSQPISRQLVLLHFIGSTTMGMCRINTGTHLDPTHLFKAFTENPEELEQVASLISRIHLQKLLSDDAETIEQYLQKAQEMEEETLSTI